MIVEVDDAVDRCHEGQWIGDHPGRFGVTGRALHGAHGHLLREVDPLLVGGRGQPAEGAHEVAEVLLGHEAGQGLGEVLGEGGLAGALPTQEADPPRFHPPILSIAGRVRHLRLGLGRTSTGLRPPQSAA